MTYRTAGQMALVTACVLGACQSYESQVYPSRPYSYQPPEPMQAAPAYPGERPDMAGTWAASNGSFVAEFRDGGFTSRHAQTSQVLAQGTYTTTGANVSMSWLSVEAQERRTATCTFTGAASVHCIQESGATFDLMRLT